MRKISKCPIFSCISRLYRPLCNFKENSLPLLHTAPLGMQCFICSLILLLFKGQEGYCISYKGPYNMQMNAEALGFFSWVMHAYLNWSQIFPIFYFFKLASKNILITWNIFWEQKVTGRQTKPNMIHFALRPHQYMKLLFVDRMEVWRDIEKPSVALGTKLYRSNLNTK